MVKRLQIFGFGRAMGIATLVLCLIAVLPISKAVADEVAQWNETTMKAIAANGQNNLVSTRTLAMVQIALHDALNAISRRYDSYYFEGPA
jgi:ABC-type phosphate/phosphonate transport system permease subunit